MCTKTGRLFYVMGASGVGKDALINVVRHTRGVHAACRYTTRATMAPSRLEYGLDRADFDRLADADAFWFAWSSYGVRYGIRRREARRLAGGWHVVVNGSRAYLAHARKACPGLVPVLVTCDDEHELRRRLMHRGREDAAAIEKRIVRGRALADVMPDDTRIIDNSGDLRIAAGVFRRLLVAPRADC